MRDRILSTIDIHTIDIPSSLYRIQTDVAERERRLPVVDLLLHFLEKFDAVALNKRQCNTIVKFLMTQRPEWGKVEFDYSYGMFHLCIPEYGIRTLIAHTSNPILNIVFVRQSAKCYTLDHERLPIIKDMLQSEACFRAMAQYNRAACSMIEALKTMGAVTGHVVVDK